MVFRIVLPHPLPPIISSPSEASDVYVPGEIEFSSAPDSTISSITLALVQTSRFKTHRPTSPTSFLCFGLSTGNDSTTEETTEIDRWSFSHPPTTALSSSLKAFRFTAVIPGHLPATTSTPIADISYHITATITASTAISTTSNTASKPLHIRRLLALPIGLTTLDYRRRFPDCNVPTSLSIPAIFRPLETCTARLTLLNTADRWLRVHKVQWRVEECTQILSRSSSPSSPTSPAHHHHHHHRRHVGGRCSTFSEKHEPNREHVRAIASGEHHVRPSEIGALYGSHISELRLDEIAFGITVPEKARLAAAAGLCVEW
ncbi:Endocytosis regulator [Diplodia intermedia]|uniref:Endocytosis regulator n=1 Tax=Diplodia intermedia TaxID=856260 RepID=A0ABR3TYJ7_9PEZI